MRVGLFLDVDGVLTVKAANLQFAQLLGVEDKLIELERRFSEGEINNDEFNADFIPLFRSAGFSQDFALKNFDNIQLRIGADRLLSDSLNTFLVTSGPSYFIDALAQRRNFPSDRIRCSRYEFDKNGLLYRCVEPVNSAMKGTFVQERAATFDVSVGVGDTDQDIEFLTHCNVRVLFGGNRNQYFTVRDLQPIIDVVRKFQVAGTAPDERHNALLKLYKASEYDKNIFIMTPFRQTKSYQETIDHIRDSLREVGLRGWMASDLTLEQILWHNVETFLIGCKAGIAVFTQDYVRHDTTEFPNAIFNPNVSIEAGYMLSRKKPVLLLKEKKLKSLPTDMVGFLYSDFELENPDSIRSAIHRWVNVNDLRISNHLR